jgi:hypothetical protein
MGGEKEHPTILRKGPFHVVPPEDLDRCQELIRLKTLQADGIERGAGKVAGDCSRQLTTLAIVFFGIGEAEVEIDDLPTPTAEDRVKVADHITYLR